MLVTSHGETIGDDHGVFGRSRLAKYSLRSALSAADAVTGCSQVVLDDLESRFGLEPGHGVVVPNGVDLDEPVGDQPPGVAGRYIAAVGRLEQMKGFDLLVDAFARAALPEDVRLVIGGEGSQEQALRTQAARLGIADRVVLTGRLDRPQVGALLRNAVAGVVPSRFEGFGISVLEIWRAERPLIATNRGGPAGLVTDDVDGILVDPLDPAALADALTTVVADPRRADRLAVEGAVRVRSLTWDRVVDDYRELYAETLRQRGKRGDAQPDRRSEATISTADSSEGVGQ
jgi:glycosyltransferase involved in cell wall biosynthesis